MFSAGSNCNCNFRSGRESQIRQSQESEEAKQKKDSPNSRRIHDWQKAELQEEQDIEVESSFRQHRHTSASGSQSWVSNASLHGEQTGRERLGWSITVPGNRRALHLQQELRREMVTEVPIIPRQFLEEQRQTLLEPKTWKERELSYNY